MICSDPHNRLCHLGFFLRQKAAQRVNRFHWCLLFFRQILLSYYVWYCSIDVVVIQKISSANAGSSSVKKASEGDDVVRPIRDQFSPSTALLFTIHFFVLPPCRHRRRRPKGREADLVNKDLPFTRQTATMIRIRLWQRNHH